MKIGEVLREKQPKEYKEINKKPKKNTPVERKEKLSTYDIEELMGVRRHRYKRSHGGAKKQI